MLIGSHYKLRSLQSQPRIIIDDKNHKQVYHSRVLGVEIDQDLSWSKHIDNVARKGGSGIGAMRRIRDFVKRDTLVLIYNALVLPSFILNTVVRFGIP